MRKTLFLLTLTALSLTAFSSQAYVEKECRKQISQFAKEFISKNSYELLNTEAQNLSFEFSSFRNTTPGSYDQKYEVHIYVAWPSKIRNLPNERILNFKLYSPFICDRLELRGFSIVEE